MNRSAIPLLARIALPLAALLAAGCIENPGLDPEVGRPAVERQSVDALFRQGNFLQLRLARDSGRITLAAVNTGLSTIDSAAFLLQVTSSHRNYEYFYPDTRPDLEFYGKVAALPPGAGADFGVIDSLLAYRLSDYSIRAWVIRAAEDGRRAGNPFGGVFTGRFRSVDSLGRSSEGPLRGLVSADGAFWFSLFRAGYELSLGQLAGSVNDSGGMASTFGFSYESNGGTGRLYAREGGFGGAFTFDKKRKPLIDSLEIEYQGYSPR